ncbi:MAG TPA: HD domain-containing phosphohydrolase, partial [Anaerolineales bacterium]|nr:HD domain-containing phosphohydrolase [Anaerolineales bacterium]
VLKWFGTCTDIHELKMAEEGLRNGEERFRALIENSSDAITLAGADGKVIYRSPAAYRILGQEPGAQRDDSLFSLVHPDDAQDARHVFAESLKGPAKSVAFQYRLRHTDGSWRWLQGTATNLLTLPAVGAIVINYRDVTAQTQSEERVKRQLEHLTAVSEIDKTIASSLDLNLSLSIILTHVIKELKVDAADILLLDAASQKLVYAAGTGFRTKALQYTRLPLGQGYAGQAGLERRLVRVDKLPMHELGLARAPDFKKEEFETYFAVPLIAKGRLVAVLEVFLRTAFEPDHEWLDFLNTLAGQAALAIDNLALFENLQRSIVDLSMAYDATIAGWSNAMDLRDEETEGHTQRVTELCVDLARRCGLREDELVQVRRGGLLHDMGKMGVPDSILLKPGPLTDEEWVVMKKHPVYAFEMLSPIQYLHGALDIPYCHHEKWDGTGYPRGLKGEQIPIAARIFAVVDVWDALTSDRPYRKAWTREKTLEHILAGSGTHFDPKIVKVFVESDALRTP